MAISQKFLTISPKCLLQSSVSTFISKAYLPPPKYFISSHFLEFCSVSLSLPVHLTSDKLSNSYYSFLCGKNLHYLYYPPVSNILITYFLSSIQSFQHYLFSTNSILSWRYTSEQNIKKFLPSQSLWSIWRKQTINKYIVNELKPYSLSDGIKMVRRKPAQDDVGEGATIFVEYLGNLSVKVTSEQTPEEAM